MRTAPTNVAPSASTPHATALRGHADGVRLAPVQLDRHGELRPDTWSKEWVCVVCGQVSRRVGARKHCSRAVSKPTLDTTGVAQRRRNVGYAAGLLLQRRTGRGFSAPTLSGAAPAVENPRSAPISEVRNHPGGVRGRDESGCDICGERVGRYISTMTTAAALHGVSSGEPAAVRPRIPLRIVQRGLGLLKDDRTCCEARSSTSVERLETAHTYGLNEHPKA
ncbi:hypothetical protein SAMN04488548_12620 [Gordonia westfalica]|uniref:Uncharacterized protein n=1 Tax=Gordonia westfalica TaxID=158898 RepID=A0A1H2E0I5_9ACTN|nr:hypothetical protein SAMN04488548_12620 [Gordonia westfalica]